jgi:hypothetical protein
MKKLLTAGMVVASTVAMANAIEIGGVKITPNVEVGWQKGEINYDVSGSDSTGTTYTGNITSDAKTEFGVGQAGLEAQYKNYFGGIKYTRDKIKGTANDNISDNQGNTFTNTETYSIVLERYFAYAGYQFNLNNVELKPYASVGYFNSNKDKGNFVGIGITGKLNLPYGFGVFASTEYDKTFGGKGKNWDNWNNIIDKDIKDTWEVSAGVSKKINFAEIYLKTYYREHKGDVTFTGNFSGGTTYVQNTNYKFKISGVMIGLNF